MTLQPPRLRISPLWLALDLVGIALVGIGVLVNAGHGNVLPEPLRFQGSGLLLIIGGIAAMLPLVWQIRRGVREIERHDARRLLELSLRSHQDKPDA